jgi:hypothetical protein
MAASGAAASHEPAAPASPQSTTTRQAATAPTWSLSTEAGLIFVGVRADAVTAFEAGLAAAHEVLAASQKTVRQSQRAGWRVYRQTDTWRTGMVLYLFVIQPVVRDVNYSLSALLLEGLPNDAIIQPAYVASLSGEQTVLACSIAADFGKAAAGGTLAAAAVAPASAAGPPPVPPAGKPAGLAPAAPGGQAQDGRPAGGPPAAKDAAQTGTAPSAASATRTFTGDLGLIVMNIKADKVAAFEAILGKLNTALTTSKDPVISRQAAGWRVFKQEKTAAGADVPFVSVITAPVPGADYTVSRLLTSAFPAERQALLDSYSTAFSGGVSLLNYALVQDFRK